MSSRLLTLFSIYLSLLTTVLCEYAQFYDKTSNIGFALSTVQNGTGTDLAFQVSAPQSAGWGAVGTGVRMDGSLMFIIYPSTQNDVTVSVRTANGHDTPDILPGLKVVVQSSKIANSIMTAKIICYNCTAGSGSQSFDTTSTAQPWIYATGPGDQIRSDSQDANIDKHKSYGVFFVNMTATISSSTIVPTLSGQENINTSPLPGSVSVLIIIHAICLGGSFVLLFPLGVIILRWFGSVRIHYLVQIIAAVICIVGLGIAIAFSEMDPEYRDMGKGHQIIGIVTVAGLLVQAIFGYVHHINYQSLGRRTWVSHLHMWTGRVLVVIGMLNTVLGFVLADLTSAAIGVAIVTVVILIGMAATAFFGARRIRLKNEQLSPDFGHILNRYDGEGCESVESFRQ